MSPKASSPSPEGSGRSNDLLAGFGIVPLHERHHKANDVDFVPKDLNPLNTPELRPIENYWAILKEHLLKRPEVVKNVEEMKKPWVNI